MALVCGEDMVTFWAYKLCKTWEKAKILSLARKGKMVILSEWDRLKPIIFLDFG